MADPVTDRDIVERFNDKNITGTGLKLLRAGMILEAAGLLDQFMLLVDMGMSDKLGPLDTMKKAIEIHDMIQKEAGSSATSPVSEKKKASVFGGK